VPTVDLPHNWQPRDYQQPAWDAWLGGCNRHLLIWHRRAGKDDIELRKHSVAAFNRIGTYWHMLPEYNQARKAIWDAVNPHTGKRRIDEAFPPAIRASTRDNDMFIRFVNGSTWQVVGSDNYNALVGTPPIGLTASEWALANPSAWGYLAPILAENGGWASFISTPRGNNHLKGMHDRFKTDPRWFCQILTANDTGVIAAATIEDQRGEYAALFGEEIADMLIEQEFYCSFAGAMVGAIFGREMLAAEREGRITDVGIDPKHPVHTAWDLGKAINNPIWCFQVIDGRPRIVDFYRPESDDLEEWVKWLDGRGYKGNDYVPHDVIVAEWGTKRTRFETLKLLGRKPKRIAKVSVADGINAARQTIKLATFDRTRCEVGIEGLKAYRREWDDERKTFLDNPVKDWAEHVGSAFRYLGLAWRDVQETAPPKPKPNELAYEVRPDGVIMGNMSVKDAIDAMVRRRRNRE
jgi:phage terminase large subunit